MNNSTISNIRRGIAWKHIRPDLTFEPKSPIGRGMPKKLVAEDISKIRSLSSAGETAMVIGKLFKVNSATIRGILAGKTWKNY